MDYQRDKWNNQTYIKNGFVLPKKADHLIIYLVRLCTLQEILKQQHISANIYSTIFLNTVMKICVISWYVFERNQGTISFLSTGEKSLHYDVFIIWLKC